jgi:hypothetical protein
MGTLDEFYWGLLRFLGFLVMAVMHYEAYTLLLGCSANNRP